MSSIDPFVEALAGRVAEKLREDLPPGRRLLSSEDAAVYLGISPEALRHWVANGRVASVRIDRHLRFDIRDLDRIVEVNKKNGI